MAVGVEKQSRAEQWKFYFESCRTICLFVVISYIVDFQVLIIEEIICCKNANGQFYLGRYARGDQVNRKSLYITYNEDWSAHSSPCPISPWCNVGYVT